MCPLVAKEVTVLSLDGRRSCTQKQNDEGNCTRKLDLWMCSLAIKEALNLCVNSRGSDRTYSRVGLWVGVAWGEGCIALVKLFSLVGSIGPNKILFNRTRLSILVRLICFDRALDAWVRECPSDMHQLFSLVSSIETDYQVWFGCFASTERSSKALGAWVYKHPCGA